MATTNYLEHKRLKMSRGANKNYWSTSRLNCQESCAIAKISARCPYTWVPLMSLSD